ncbi:MAG: type II secretion system F family protein [Candidatus Bathyarchaeota archaeon]|nr:type II secretion system F family protein [Candidatus Bathyarchaeota archaeon]
MNIRDFCYSNFGWLGRGLFTIIPGFEKDLDSAYMKIHPEVYLSILGFVSLVSVFASILVGILMFVGLIPSLSFLPSGGLLFSPMILVIPLLVLVLGVLYPKTAASNRVAGLKIEIPYASMYISTMTSGGLSPYESILRLRNMDLLPNMRDEVGRIDIIVKSQGVDPVKAMEQAAKVIDLKDYKELLLGYASSVRTGGDTLHYLFNQTESMFRTMSTRIKTLGENMGMLMEAYTIIGILGVLGIFLIFVVGMALPGMGMDLSPAQFFLFSFIVLPMLSVVFIYFADASQISYPISNWKTYTVFALCLPVSALIGSQLTLPAFNDSFLVFPPLYNLILWLRDLLNLSEGTEAALGLAITLILIALPGAIADMYYIGREGKILDGINNFLRDLVETRKSGLAPERCIHALAGRDYGAFSKYLEIISMKIHWGYPLRKIYVEFRQKIKNWLALVNIYLLVDTIEVGGGTEKSLETLANFAESTKHLEDEKSAVLMPLTIVPYIGAALFTGTTVMFLSFFTNMSMLGVSIAKVTLYRVLLTPLGLHTWILGLVTGKIVSGRVSAGFKHSILLTIVSILGIWAVSNMSVGGGI